MLKKRTVALVIVCLIGSISLIGCIDADVKRGLKNGMTALENGQYEQAKQDFENVLREDKQNVDANRLLSVINNYESAKKEFEEGNLEKAESFINKIPQEYINYKIKDDVKKLQNEINEKKKSN